MKTEHLNNRVINASLWQRLNALITYLNRHLATQAKCAAAIRRRGRAYDYLTYLHPHNVKLLQEVIKKAKGYRTQLKRDGTGKVTVDQARTMLMDVIGLYDQVDIETDYRYVYQYHLNMGRLQHTASAKMWENPPEYRESKRGTVARKKRVRSK